MFKAVLIDISGTLIVNDNQTQRSVVAALSRLSIPHKLLSNASKQSHSDAHFDLTTKLGLDISLSDLITPLSSCSQHIRDNNLNPLLLLTQSASKDFEGLVDSTKPLDSVVVGLAPDKFDYHSLNVAFRILKDIPQSQLIATHSSLYFQDKDDQLSLGPGPFIHALQSASGKSPLICGKPSSSFFITALDQLGISQQDYKDVAIVGDDALSDLGTDLPLAKILVKTGKYREGDERKIGRIFRLPYVSVIHMNFLFYTIMFANAFKQLPQQSRSFATTALRLKHTLPPLPYAYDALEPHISSDIHHATYVNGLNAAEESYVKAQNANDIKTLIALQPALKFNGGGHINHSLFWKNLTPDSGRTAPSGGLAEQINKDFGSFDALKGKVNAATAAIQGSGWGWLGYNKEAKRLEVATTANQDPLTHLTPIVGIDIWEHAFYLQYKNVKPDYLNAIWNVMDMQEAGKRFDEAA
ncbi:hypothetical protein E3P98_01620 [Wallemia ichthyophaga]|nr:hypothetical protein E3P98_01620 [Wallemia ichthyophaga]